MTETQIPWVIVILLLGVILGGAGQAKLFKKGGRMLGLTTDDQTADPANVATEAASRAIARATKQFRDELNTHVSTLNDHVQGLEKAMHANNTATAEIDKKLATLLGVCGERHKALDRRIDTLTLEAKGGS